MLFVVSCPGSADKEILPGNPNVVLVSLGKLVSEDKGLLTLSIIIKPSLSPVWFYLLFYWLFYLPYNADACILPVQTIQGEPTLCSQCGSVLDAIYDNVVIT